ncbi:MAG: phospholipid carrier-dependent glycosyltransferase, partial [bacterium]
MQSKNKETATLLLLAAIVAFGFAVRVARLDSAPPGFYIDEASFGYNAYSILTTGRDEFGTFLPLYTPSFGTGKNPVYLYATAASVAAFGLNETAVRLPAAVFGALTVLLTYLLGAALTKRRSVGLLAALFLALSPWHIFFSRFAVETTSMVFFITLGVYLLVRGLERPGALAWGALALGVSLYTYAPALP